MDAAAEESGIDYCLQQIRRYDRDRYLTVLAAPQQAAADLAVLYAFNLEIALVRDLGQRVRCWAAIRLQWWREAIAGAYEGRPRRHAVLESLAALHARRAAHPCAFRPHDRRPPRASSTRPCSADLRALEVLCRGRLRRSAAPRRRRRPRDCAIPIGDVAALIRHVGIGFGLTGIARATLYLARQAPHHAAGEPAARSTVSRSICSMS